MEVLDIGIPTWGTGHISRHTGAGRLADPLYWAAIIKAPRARAISDSDEPQARHATAVPRAGRPRWYSFSSTSMASTAPDGAIKDIGEGPAASRRCIGPAEPQLAGLSAKPGLGCLLTHTLVLPPSKQGGVTGRRPPTEGRWGWCSLKGFPG